MFGVTATEVPHPAGTSRYDLATVPVKQRGGGDWFVHLFPSIKCLSLFGWRRLEEDGEAREKLPAKNARNVGF